MQREGKRDRESKTHCKTVERPVQTEGQTQRQETDNRETHIAANRAASENSNMHMQNKSATKRAARKSSKTERHAPNTASKAHTNKTAGKAAQATEAKTRSHLHSKAEAASRKTGEAQKQRHQVRTNKEIEAEVQS